jgi:peptidoglycan DL-endopeptidase CwlO
MTMRRRRAAVMAAVAILAGVGMGLPAPAGAAPPMPAGLFDAPATQYVQVRTHRRSVERDRIAEVQRALRRDGYRVSVDGRYGRSTRDALLRYQARHGLHRTGEPDAATRRALGIG